MLHHAKTVNVVRVELGVFLLSNHILVDFLEVLSPFWNLFVTNVESALFFCLRFGLDGTVENIGGLVGVGVGD